MVGAVEEGKTHALKKKQEEQDYYDTLRKSGYSESQALDMVEENKSRKQVGTPNDAYLKGERDAKLKKSEIEVEKAGLERDKLQHEKDTGYTKPADDLTANQADENLRNKSAALRLIRNGQYFDTKTGKFERVKNAEQMTSYLIDKFPGKVNFDDPEVAGALSERYPDAPKRLEIIDKIRKKAGEFLRGGGKDEVTVKAKKSGRKFKTTKEKAQQAIDSGLFEAAG